MNLIEQSPWHAGERQRRISAALGAPARPAAELLDDLIRALGMPRSLGAVNIGYHSGPAADDAGRMALVEEGAGLFRAAGIESQAMPNLQQARWQKLVWNIPYNGLSVLLGAGTTPLMADTDSRALIQALMAEVVQGAIACGHEVPPGYADHLFTMTEKMPDYWPSMYHDFLCKRPLELAAIYARPLAAAKAAGYEMPRVEALYQSLSFIDRRNA